MMRSLLEPNLVPGLVTRTLTTVDGRFEFIGVGHERFLTLTVLHPAIQDAQFEVMSRVAPDVRTIVDQDCKPGRSFMGRDSRNKCLLA